jgi:uncharacterized protein
MRAILRDLALDRCPPFFRDWQFLTALAAGAAFWILLRWLMPNGAETGLAITAIVSLCLLQPILEELIFRGVVQSELLHKAWGRMKHLGISSANALTSLVFTALHFVSHPPLWAVSVIVPSLLFGYFRERHSSVYPPLALHIYYNTGYFLTTGFYR